MPADDLIAAIRDAVIGLDEVVDGPFGPRPVIYADYTASGRSLSFIEDHLRSVVLPLYANTHTESSGTGLQTTRFREEAREIIRRCVGATDEHAVLFCGSGSTYAVDRLIGVLGLRLPCQLDDRYHLLDHIPADERPVVFIGPTSTTPTSCRGGRASPTSSPSTRTPTATSISPTSRPSWSATPTGPSGSARSPRPRTSPGS